MSASKSVHRSSYYQNLHLPGRDETKSAHGRAPVLIVLLIASFLVLGFRLSVSAFGDADGAYAAIKSWPQNSAIVKADGKYEYLLFVHGRDESARPDMLRMLEFSKQPDVRTTIVFRQPRDLDQDGQAASLYSQCKGMRRLNVIADSGFEFANFGVRGSRKLLIFDAAGHLMYAGDVPEFPSTGLHKQLTGTLPSALPAKADKFSMVSSTN